MSPKVPADRAELRDMIVEVLAEVRGCAPGELTGDGGQPCVVEMTAKETMAVSAAIEDLTGRSNLVTPDDFSTPRTRPCDQLGRDVTPGGCMDPGEGGAVDDMVDLLSQRLGLSG
jgi:hypothetical protein